ncbi:MGT family glycosyltransferase [Inquilinus ginsengisoli]|uniref:MGT family glycosyltransferase n=1 Tax=Inquilinus ginsengisoli TaxID=363840 RepID=A0ABU1JP67_9PROT|nr:glycosyltransferase [Inquilinus ginsengisoli]MDR6289784.1 MGT family glycosyltransferase [Inquilinus ginsengisoli]
MKVLISAPPFVGHLNPVLAIGRILMARGHEVVVTTGSFLRDTVEASGASFVPLLPGADFDSRDMFAVHPGHRAIPPGPRLVEAQVGDFLIEPLPQQVAGLRQILAEFPADIIVSDAMFHGTIPLLLGPGPRPAILYSCPHFLFTERDDGAPHGPGLPPAETDAQRDEYRAIRAAVDAACLDPLKARLDRRLAEQGIPATTLPYFDTVASVPDVFLQTTVPGFEYPRRTLPPTVRFIGTLPLSPSRAPDPDWIGDLDGRRRVVLVTQGTLANYDLGQLIGPTLAGLANEPDVLVLATTGGAPLSSIPGPIPANARTATYLPFDRLLPRVDVIVTNGGYGTVNLALKAGVPLVAAGMTEDKTEINARIAWSGAGINLATNNPTPEALRAAVRTVLDGARHRDHARRLAAEFARIDTEAEVLRLVEGSVRIVRPRARSSRSAA